jgi:hypothetical protein
MPTRKYFYPAGGFTFCEVQQNEGIKCNIFNGRFKLSSPSLTKNAKTFHVMTHFPLSQVHSTVYVE